MGKSPPRCWPKTCNTQRGQWSERSEESGQGSRRQGPPGVEEGQQVEVVLVLRHGRPWRAPAPAAPAAPAARPASTAGVDGAPVPQQRQQATAPRGVAGQTPRAGGGMTWASRWWTPSGTTAGVPRSSVTLRKRGGPRMETRGDDVCVCVCWIAPVAEQEGRGAFWLVCTRTVK